MQPTAKVRRLILNVLHLRKEREERRVTTPLVPLNKGGFGGCYAISAVR